MFGWLREKLNYANVMATLAGFIALGGGAYAVTTTGIPDGNGIFHGCFDRRTGVLRVVKSSQSCRQAKRRYPGEFAIAWNQRGIPGVNGTNGTDGPNGPNGATGAAGANGANGASGTHGAAGATGATGATGGNGATGATGA